jgi:LysM repeat protein/F0F1-type ATP synthase membrane subunit b/b'
MAARFRAMKRVACKLVKWFTCRLVAVHRLLYPRQHNRDSSDSTSSSRMIRCGQLLSGNWGMAIGGGKLRSDGSTFTEAEARNLQVGQSVYLPVSYQTGSGNPVTSPPVNNSKPVQPLPSGDRPYAIQSGDSLWAIAQRELGNGDRWREIKKANGTTFTEAESRRLQVGQVIYLPGSGTTSPRPQQPTTPTGRPYNVRSGDTLWAIAQRELGNGNRWREIKKADGSTFTEAEAQTLWVGQLLYLPGSAPTGGTPITPGPTQPADFRRSLAFVRRWEGGYVNHPNDPGGATNKGVIQSTYNAYRASKGLPARDVRWIEDREVEDIYYKMYWIESGSDRLTSRLAMVHFDTYVNMGNTATRLLQQARQSASGDEMSVVKRYLDLREAEYRAIVANKPSMGVFLQGWLNRLNSLRAEVGTTNTATDDDYNTDDSYNYDEEDDSLPIGQLIANEVVELTRESLKGLNQAIADGIRSQFDGIISPLQNKVDEAEKKVANLKSQLESKTDGIINSISSRVIGGLNATAKNELRNAIDEVTNGDFVGGAASVTQAVLAKLSGIGLGFVAGLIEGWVDDRIDEALAPVEEALKTANQGLLSAKEELQKVTEVVQQIIDYAIDAAADQLNEWTPYVANIVQALFYAGEEWVNNLTNPKFWMNPELWTKFAEFIKGLLITAAVSFIAGAIAGAIGSLISAAGWGITIPAGVATAAAIFATIMGALIGAYMSRDELMALYESAKTAFTNLNEGAKSSTTDKQLQIVGERFASESTDALGKLVTIVANVGVGAIAGGVGSKVGSSITSKLVGKGFKAPVSKGFEAPKKYLNAKNELTNGTYTVNNTDMAKHKTGSFKADTNRPKGISQFLPTVDAESAVLDAAASADKYGLWVGKDSAKATVFTNDYIGALRSSGERTKYLHVYKMKNGYIHGSPATPPVYP